MKIVYTVDVGFEVDGVSFSWGEARASVREKLKQQHKVADQKYEMSHLFDGDTSHDIDVRKDIFENIQGEQNYFFFSYTKDDALLELEVHEGVSMEVVGGPKLEFGQEMADCLRQFVARGASYKNAGWGSYLIQDFKLLITDAEGMGGEGNGLAYFYAGKRIEHLLQP